MALTISLSTAIATTRTSWTLTDGTTYGTGGNPARADVAVFVTAYKMDKGEVVTETLTVTGNNSNPETDSSWTITYTIDGYYKVYFAIIPDYSGATTYAKYAAVYSGGSVYRSLQNSNTGNAVNDTNWWEPITSPATLANNKGTSTESANITSLVYLRVFSANSQYEFANQVSDQCSCTDCDELESLNNYIIFRRWLDGAAIADSRSEVIDGEVICRRIQSRFIDC